MAEIRIEAGRLRVWPGVAAPVGLTLLLAIATWLFISKVMADREEVESASLRRESYARLEAGELVASAKKYSLSFIDSKIAERRDQEKNLQLEARGILDSVYRLLTASLDRARKNAVSRRDVGAFPPGFEGVRSFLEIVPSTEEDEALAALRAANPELSALLPAGCSLAVIEDSSRLLFSVGGGIAADDTVSVAMTRDFIFNDGGRSRLWSLRVEVFQPDKHPLPGASAVAEHLSAHFSELHLDGISWQGWLLGGGGEVSAAFGPRLRTGTANAAPEPPPFIDIQGEWMDLDGQRLVWLQKSGRDSELEWQPAVAVAMAKPEPPLEPFEAFLTDRRWAVTFVVLSLLALVGWGWFIRTMLASRRAEGTKASVQEKPAPAAAKKEELYRQGRRLVRTESSAGNDIPKAERRQIIVAEIGEDGQVRLDELLSKCIPPAPPQPSKLKIPSGSLSRLQAIHRGGEGLRGSRILDQARSPVLKKLAARVRPAPDRPIQPSPPPRKPTEIISNMKSPLGWKKIE